jgi:carbon-monoxide dehydrogenase small subunit
VEHITIVHVTINGRKKRAAASPRTSAVEFIRQQIGLTGTHIGCEHGVCGACTIIVDGCVVRGCLMFAVQMENCIVETIEGASETGRIRVLQDAFIERNALQCGFCTPGMLLTAAEFLEENANPCRQEIREALSGNLCRCTGYEAIVDAVEIASKSQR